MIYPILFSFLFLQPYLDVPTCSTFSSTATAILPEELQLEITPISEQEVQLVWHYKNAHAVAFFEIQRSHDGVNFSTIAQVTCLDDTIALNTYEFTDNNPINAINYYRLSLVNLHDEHFANTPIQAVPLSKDIAISIFPNPVQDILQVMGIGEAIERYEVQIFDMQGYLLQTLPIHTATGIYTNYIDVKGLSAGVYFLKVLHANRNVQSAIFVKQ